MILPPYPAYKDSGVPWMGEVPAHWDVLRAKHVFTPIDVRSKTGEEELLTVSSKDGVVPRREKQVTMFMAASYVGHKLCWPGDLVINSLWAWATGLGFSRYHGIVSSAYGVYRPRLLHSNQWIYFNYLLRSHAYNWELHVRSKGIWTSRLQLTDESFLDMPIVVPSEEDAHAIVRFLDYIDRRINRYIRAKRKLIKLLEEQKQAIIHQAVTRGLDPDVEMRPSGVEWLGDIPVHWEVVRIKHLLRQVDIRSTTGEETLLSLRMNHGIVPHADHFARPGQAASLVGYKVVEPGQIVLNKLQANNGLVFVSKLDGVVSPDYAVYEGIRDDSLEYLTSLFRTSKMKHKFRVESKGLGTGTAGFLRLYPDSFEAISVAVPPTVEQLLVLEELERRTAYLKRSIAKAEGEIDLIREYRTRLVADVVTGKLDVREAATALLDELSAPEDMELDEGLEEDFDVEEEMEEALDAD